MQRLAPVEHRHERQYLGRRIVTVEERAQLVERAHRQRRRHRRDEQGVRCAEHGLAAQRDAGSAVEDRHVVVVVQRFEEGLQAGHRAGPVGEADVEVTQGEVGGNEVHPDIGLLEVDREPAVTAE